MSNLRNAEAATVSAHRGSQAMTTLTKRAREVMEGVTEGPWEWFGNTNHHEVYLATKDRGRIFVMDFVRWGMAGAQPRFQVALNSDPHSGVMRSIGEMAKNEAVSKPAVLFGPLYEAPYRKQFTGIGHPNARFIAASRSLVPALTDRVELLERLLARALDLGDAACACTSERGRNTVRGYQAGLDAIRAELGGDE